MEDAGLASGVQRCLVCAAAWCPKGQLESLLKLRHLPPALERREMSETVIEHWTNCPTCDGPLVEIEAHGVPVRACAKCLGTLIPNGAFERLQSA